MDYRNYDRGYAEPTMSASDYMTRTYRWMASGLLITFAMAYITATTPLLYLVDSLYLVLTIAELALVFVLSSRVQTMSVQGARATFFGYALLNGMVLSYYFLAFSVGTLILAFLSTALYFGLMAVYGTTTHRDLSGWGPKLMMGLFAITEVFNQSLELHKPRPKIEFKKTTLIPPFSEMKSCWKAIGRASVST